MERRKKKNMSHEQPYRAEIVIILSNRKGIFEVFDHIDFDEHMFEEKELMLTRVQGQLKHIKDTVASHIQEREFMEIKITGSFRKRKRSPDSFSQKETIPINLHEFEPHVIREWLNNLTNNTLFHLCNILMRYPKEGKDPV